MRILMAAGVPKRREGGAAAMLYNLAKELEARGHCVSCVFLEDLGDFRGVPQRFADAVFAFRLARYVRRNREKFSVVNIHAPWGFVYGYLRRISPRNDLPPYVMTLHGLEERRIHVMSREAKKGRAWHFSWKNRLWHRLYHMPRFRWSIRSADGVHCMARDVWTILQLKYDLDSDRVAYVANGIEPRFFMPREYRNEGRLRLLYPGTWLDQRGIFYLRDALQRLAERIPTMTLTVAGPGVPGQGLHSFFGDALRERIDVREAVPWDRMPELYAEHDIFVFPSLMEGLPSVLLEAMASGMPVITTNTCGMPDVVQDEVNGLLIPPADATALEAAILRLNQCVELRRKLGEAARESMRHCTWERAGEKLEEFLRHVIQKETGHD